MSTLFEQYSKYLEQTYAELRRDIQVSQLDYRNNCYGTTLFFAGIQAE